MELSFKGSSCSCSTMKSTQMIETFIKESGKMISEVFVASSDLRQNNMNCALTADDTPPSK